MTIALDVQHLVKCYGKKQAVKDVSFQIQEGEIFGLMGMNGAGKTTILRMLATLLKPDSGDAFIAGNSIVKNPEKVRACISYLPDEAGAYKTMTGKNYLAFIAGLYFKNEQEQKNCIALGEEICGLGDALAQKINTYSRGMTRKLVLARTVMTKPKLAILDEPTSGLDVLNSLDIRKTIRKCAETYGTAFLLSSHHMQEISTTANRCAIMKDGIFLAEGSPQELLAKYQAESLEEAFEKAVRTS
ncbi:MAG: ABC transporter ATP-binding protein [Oscillospiraceae bacterium]|nr:ABC transporter ATP-binding protein [Oscillospiraceae bacterium]MDE6657357.1 ABC transporter ATP-binding protein [Oscillospiraceae bacterium]